MKSLSNSAKRLPILLGSLVLLLAGFLLPRQEKMRRLRVSPGLWPGSEAIVLAHAKGELPAEQFQLIELPWSSAAMRALGSGAADVAVVTLDAVLRMREAGQRLRVLMVLDESTGADVILARHSIGDIKALKNMRVGVDVRGVGAFLLANALERTGMFMNDVRLVPLVQSEMEQAVTDAVVDAVVVSEPWASRLGNAGLHVIYDSKQLQVPIMRVMVASEHACEQFRPRLVALLRAQIETTPLVRSGKPFADMELLLRREKIDAAMFNRELTTWRPVDADGNRDLLTGDRPKLAEMADKLAGQMLRAGLLKSKPAEQTWIDATFFVEAAP
jgi:NitT/TauT family transport system substrate-binding protein